MIKSFKIDNFKSLNEFQLPAEGEGDLGHFVCLIGLNGSGKSTVLQALDFVSQLVVGDVDGWLSARGWSKSDLTSKHGKKRNIAFELRVEIADYTFDWKVVYNSLLGRCTREDLRVISSPRNNSTRLPQEEVLFSHDGAVFKTSAGYRRDLLTDFDGSLFAKLKTGGIASDTHRVAIELFKICMEGVKSLELLNPHAMRRPSKKAIDVGLGGEDLAAFVHGLDKVEANSLNEQISKIYPHIEGVRAKNAQYGWKRLKVFEKYGGGVEFDARHANDGLLRVAAIVAQTVAEAPFMKEDRKGNGSMLGNPEQRGYDILLLDEIENGINPEVICSLVAYLSAVRQQVFFTTHSPMILNYLEDDVATNSVFLVYRRSDGSSGVVRFYSIPSVKERLEVMGPGEAFADVSLADISRNEGETARAAYSIW